MLKGINPLLGPELLKVLRAMGHGDEIAIVDGNYPADSDAKRLVRMDGVNATDVLDAILSVMPLDEMVPEASWRPAAYSDPKKMEPVFKEFEKILATHEPKQKMHVRVGTEFYDRVKAAYAIVATTEARLYGNIILRKGVIHPA
jgi:L-fucose mutarotase